MKTSPIISIITATNESSNVIDNLIDNLNDQSFQDFKWIVIDNYSNDGTIKKVSSRFTGNLLIVSEKDKGIYHAINKAILACGTDFYLVIGSDDILYPNTLKNFIEIIQTVDADVYVAKTFCEGKILQRRNRFRFFNRQFNYITSHSVSTVFRTKSHAYYGLYRTDLKVASDQDFIMSLAVNDCTFYQCDFIAGEFVKGGISSIPSASTLREIAQVQSKYDGFLFVYLVFLAKIAKLMLHMIKGFIR